MVIQSVSRYVVQHSADRALELAEVVVTHLPIIMEHVQPLEGLLGTHSTTSGWQKSCACHMTRLSLHIHWTVLSVAYRLAPLVGKSRLMAGLCTPASHCPTLWTQDGGCFCHCPDNLSPPSSPMLPPSILPPPPAPACQAAPVLGSCGYS